MKIVHVLAGEILAPAARAQSFPLLAALSARGHETEIVAAVSLRRWLRPGPYALPLAEARASAGRVRLVPHLPGHRWPFLTARLIGRAARKARPDVVHARQARAAALALRAGLAPVVADLRGIRPEEFLLAAGRPESGLSPRERRSLAALRADERAAIDRAGAVVCVSEAFRRRLGGGRASSPSRTRRRPCRRSTPVNGGPSASDSE